MSISVIAHFNYGRVSPFPAGLEGIAGEGEVFKNPHSGVPEHSRQMLHS